MSLSRSVTVSILKKFSADELTELSAFIHYCAGDRSNAMKRAMAFFKSCAPAYDSKVCSKENFSKKVFGKKLTVKLDKEINRLMSELKEEIEKFIVYKYAISNLQVVNTAKSKWFYMRNHMDLYDKLLKKMETDIFLNKSEDALELYNQYLGLKINRSQHNKDSALSYFILEHQLEFQKNKADIEYSLMQIGFANMKRILNKNSTEELQKRVRNDYLKLDFKKETAFLKALSKFIQLPSIKLYDFLKNQVLDNSLLLDYTDRYNALIILANNISVLTGKRDVEREHLYLDRLRLEMNESANNGRVFFTQIDSYFNSLLTMNMVEEAKSVLNKYAGSIIGIEDEANYQSICKAKLLHKEKQYSEALYIINQCHAENKHQQVHILRLKVVLAYEMGERMLFASYVNNLRKYISSKGKKEFSKPTILQYLAVVKYLTQLFDAKEPLDELRTKAMMDEDLYIKQFVLEKIEEKRNRRRH